MTGVSRRELLRTLGVGGGALTLLPFAAACRAKDAATLLSEQRSDLDPLALHRLLRNMVANLSRVFDHAEGWIEHGQRTFVVADEDGKHFAVETSRRAVLTGINGGNVFVRTTSDLSVDGLAGAAALLRTKGGATRRARQERALEQSAPTVELDPRRTAATVLATRVDELQRRARKLRDSRIIYRGAALTLHDSDIIHVGPDAEYIDRRLWSHASVVLGAKTARGYEFESAVAAGFGGLELTAIDDEALARAAASALTILTPRAAPHGATTVLLSPEVAAAIVANCLAPAFAGDLWLRGGPPSYLTALEGASSADAALSLTASPRARGTMRDDEGSPVRRVRLIEAGRLGAPLTDRRSARVLGREPTGNGWRLAGAAFPTPCARELAVTAGSLDHQSMVAGIEDGLLLEGAATAQSDLATGEYRVRVRRAHGIRRGVLSGFVYGDLELRGSLAGLLNSVRAIGRDEVAVMSLRTDGGVQRVRSPALTASGIVGGWR